MTIGETNSVLLALGKAQVDAMFRRQEAHTIDDSEFLPLLEVVLNAFETAGIEKDVAEEVWEYAFAVYDGACKKAEPTSTSDDNRNLMRRYLLGGKVKGGEYLRWLQLPNRFREWGDSVWLPYSLPRSGYIPQPWVSGVAAPPWETSTTGTETP